MCHTIDYHVRHFGPFRLNAAMQAKYWEARPAGRGLHRP